MQPTIHAIDIVSAQFPADAARVRALIEEYVDWLALDLAFQGLAHELDHLDTVYGAPDGFVLLATVDGEAAGCVACKRYGEGVGEVKRLYVRPAFRGRGLGFQLLDSLLQRARRNGTQCVLLDAVPQTIDAQRMYLRMGFQEVPTYYASPLAGTRYYQYRIGKLE